MSRERRVAAPAVTHRLAASADRHQRCHGTVGSRPAWMSPDQYDASGGPCPCLLWAGHPPPCICRHTQP